MRSQSRLGTSRHLPNAADRGCNIACLWQRLYLYDLEWV